MQSVIEKNHQKIMTEKMLEAAVKAELRAKKASLIAHYYVDGKLQTLAEQSGGIVADSLEMARFGKQSNSEILIIAGVRFMGETAKILSPEKKVFVIDESATCSLDESCPIDDFSRFCEQYPKRKIVVYANTSAAVKARADWVVTSSSAVAVVNYLHHRGEKILWAPDKHLGNYIKNQTGADMILWDGACVVHEKFKAEALENLARRHPDAAVLVHPEAPEAVVALADVVGSTTTLINAVKTRDEDKFIVATDNGIFHKMHEVAPQKKLIEAPSGGVGADCESCAHCEWMAKNTLEKCLKILQHGQNEILIDEKTRRKAQKSIQRLLDFTHKK